MADDQDSLIIRPSKKTPLVLRMLVLIFAMASGIYICSICVRQIGGESSRRSVSIRVVERPCEATGIEPWEKPYLHFPKPKTFRRDECACNPVRYFAILATQRSGSGWFETLLNSHINISSNGEIFSVKVRRSNLSTIVETLDKVYNLDWLSSASKNECTAAVGFKWMLNQGLIQNHEEIVEYFNTKGVSAIFLFRRNLLRRMISILGNSYDQKARPLNGTHKSHVHSTHEAEILARYKPTINTTFLIPHLQQVEDLVTKSLQYLNGTRHIILYYEDIKNNLTKLVDVQEFLNVPQRDLSSRQVKIHKGALSSQIENWEEVEKTLKGTRYESFLRDDYKV
ncbi:P-loop containing nucleoside triphosphate hydrolases superfamily protein [Perilla frutescens var. frutescens]|nr:P-loop containing nucleoside triphosphate hydrolases superfamily protein [Perilla frutescens var. frutescens]